MDASGDLGFDQTPELPTAISCVADRYLLFDIKIATWLRRQHNICGVTIGSLPLAPSQNMFLGVPVEIMPEEAQLLVERGIGFILDDARAHDEAIRASDGARRADYLARLRKQAEHLETVKLQEKAESRKRALEKRSKKAAASSGSTPSQPSSSLLDFDDAGITPTFANTASSTISEREFQPSASYDITPATSNHLLVPSMPTSTSNSITPKIHNLPTSYPLYRHLHDKGYFMTPGLRFGCQYTVYPGDPLRFHSHFLAVGRQWDEEIDLMDIVGGGRLGTGVKKGFLFGGEDPGKGEVRTFSVEWAAM